MPVDKDKPKNSISHKQIEVVDIVLFQINCIEVQSQNIKYITAQHCMNFHKTEFNTYSRYIANHLWVNIKIQPFSLTLSIS